LLVESLGAALREHRDELYALSARAGSTLYDAKFDVDGGIGVLLSYASKAKRELPNEVILAEGAVEPLGKGGAFVGQHILTPLRGVAVQINAFNFPVWGPLEKFAPAFIAGVPSLVKPATQTAYLTARLVELIIEGQGDYVLTAKGNQPTLCEDIASLFDLRQYSLVHFNAIFDNPLTIRSIYNAVEVGLITAVVGGALAFAIGYTVHRTHVPGRRLIDLIATLPVAIPGLVIGVAYLWAWIGIPGGLYGTLWILALAFIARFMPDTVKALSTSFLQIHRELEEAAWVCGKGMLTTIASIVLPLARPGVIASMTLLFVLAIRELGSSLFLYTSNTMVMSVLLLDYYEGGNIGKTAAFSLVQTVLLGALIGGANWLARSAAQGGVAQRIR